MRTLCIPPREMAWLTTFKHMGLTDEIFTRLVASGILADVLNPAADLTDRSAIREALKLGTLLPKVFPLAVDHSASLETMIFAGRYAWVNKNIISGCFPIHVGSVIQYKARYFHFDRKIKAANVIKEMVGSGWWPAKLEHLLSFGKTYPNEQLTFEIVGLGSTVEIREKLRVPCLHKNPLGRILSVDLFSCDWDPTTRFLALCEA